jgi:hypothetical protein
MTYHLSVTQAFGDYARGDRITDPDTVAAVFESHPQNVVRVVAPEAVALPVTQPEF